MSGIPSEFVEWYFSDIPRTAARRLGIQNWAWRDSSELLEEIKLINPPVYEAIESFKNHYQQWAAATHTHGTDAQYMLPLMLKREEALDSLVKAVGSAG